MNARQRLLDAGCEDAVLFEYPTYDDALIGVDSNGRAIYDYGKMIDWMVEVEGFTRNPLLSGLTTTLSEPCLTWTAVLTAWHQ